MEVSVRSAYILVYFCQGIFLARMEENLKPLCLSRSKQVFCTNLESNRSERRKKTPETEKTAAQIYHRWNAFCYKNHLMPCRGSDKSISLRIKVYYSSTHLTGDSEHSSKVHLKENETLLNRQKSTAC